MRPGPAPDAPGGATPAAADASTPIPALLPRGRGHQFVCYADACSGVPGARHEATFAAVNAVVARLRPRPEFILFPGDEVIGLTTDDDALRAQWRHFLDRELAWLDRDGVPVYHTTGNHTTYDAGSEAAFRDILAHLPRNGPTGQEGLSYWVRRGDLLVVAVNTFFSGLGGEGRVETDWLDRVLGEQADARHKLVMGHHPVHPVNGFAGAYVRELAPADGAALWGVLVRHGVLAYVCSHILAFDVQVHEGLLQLLTAGAGTAHRMPEGIEYLHCVQAALDGDGLRYQVLDVDANVREWLSWPPRPPSSDAWSPLGTGVHAAPDGARAAPRPGSTRLVAWRVSGTSAAAGPGEAQTLVSAWDDGPSLAPVWIGLLGPEQRLGVLATPAPGRSPALWLGPALPADAPFDLQLALHAGMGPGGVLWRPRDGAPWSSLAGSSAWGPDRFAWPALWGVGHAQRGPADRPFRGRELRVAWFAETSRLEGATTIPGPNGPA